MATITIEKARVNKESVTKVACSAETSQPVFVPGESVGIDVIVTSGTATVQQSSGLPSEISAGTATWINWGSGAVAANTGSIVTGATAVRLVATGVASLYVRT